MAEENESLDVNLQAEKENTKTWIYDEFQDDDFADMFRTFNVPEELQNEILNIRDILDRNVIVGDGKMAIYNGSKEKKQLLHNLNKTLKDIGTSLGSQKPTDKIEVTLELEEKLQLFSCLKKAAEFQGVELCMNIISLYNKRPAEAGTIVYDKYRKTIIDNIQSGKWNSDFSYGDYSVASRKYPDILNKFLDIFEETKKGEQIFELIEARPRFAREISQLFKNPSMEVFAKQKLLQIFHKLRNFLPVVSCKPGNPIDLGLKDGRTARVLDTADPEAITSKLEENKGWLTKLLHLLPEGEDRLIVRKTLEGHAVVVLEKYFDGVMIRIDHSAEPVIIGESERQDSKIEFKSYHLVLHSSGLVETDMMFDQDIRFDCGYLLREKGPVNEVTLICNILDVVEDGKDIDIGESCGFTDHVLSTYY